MLNSAVCISEYMKYGLSLSAVWLLVLQEAWTNVFTTPSMCMCGYERMDYQSLIFLHQVWESLNHLLFVEKKVWIIISHYRQITNLKHSLGQHIYMTDVQNLKYRLTLFGQGVNNAKCGYTCGISDSVSLQIQVYVVWNMAQYLLIVS